MAKGHDDFDVGGQNRRRLFVYNGGFLTQRRLRRILTLDGWDIRLGLARRDDWVGVWGQSPTARRGLAMAARRGAGVLRVEDAFLRSLRTGRDGDPPIGLSLDRSGMHFDPSHPSDLEQILATHPMDGAALLARARAGAQRLKALDLSKYNAFDPDMPEPAPGYVLVIDQTRGDASVLASGASRAEFLEMLVFAQEEHPGAKILIKTHPETAAGHREGYFSQADESARVTLYAQPISPWRLLAGARAVYTISSQLGFEAILAGHKPRVFGQPFYAGWGLTTDERPVARRERQLTRTQLFLGAMILYPKWYDPYRDRLCTLEDAIETLGAEVTRFRQDRHGHVAIGMRLWKRRFVQRIFGAEKRMIFDDQPDRALTKARQTGRSVMIWAGKETAQLADQCRETGVRLYRVEDGFLRSKGLGAKLIPPLSLVLDDLGIYYDPTRPSRLEALICAAPDLDKAQKLRAERLIDVLIKAGLSKYNLGPGTALPPLGQGRHILVPGQVEDDASIRKGCTDVATNLDLLRATRAANPDAVILFKPHPDVEAGLRTGAVPADEALKYADHLITAAGPIAAINAVGEIWTMTSLLGFEGLLRGRKVTCLGVPFYAGWGLTTDLSAVPERRKARPTLPELVHATLIGYPRYFDPVTGRPCPVEIVAERLAKGQIPRPGPFNTSLSKLQGMFASFGFFWR